MNELVLVASAWTEVLFGMVPSFALEACLIKALRDRRSTFPVGVSEICAAWRGEETNRGPVKDDEDPEAKRIRESCVQCHGTKFEVVPVTLPDGTKTTAMKFCDHK